MKLKHAGWAIALAATAAAPAFAQSTVTSGTGATVTTSSTNVVVTPAMPAPAIAARTVTVPGAVVSEIGSHTLVNGDSKTTVTSYWVNVPQDVTRDPSFQRWQSLK